MFINYSLRTKMIVAFLVVALLALGPLAFLNTHITRAALTDKANQALFAAASQTAANLETVISDNLDAVRTEAMLPDVVKYLGLPPDQRPGSAEEARVADTLIDLLNKNLFYISSYALLDRQGRNVVDTLQSDIGQDESDRDYFQAPLQTGLPYASPVEFTQMAGGVYLYFSSPVRNEARQTIGVLRVRYSVGVLQEMVSESQGLAGEGSFAILLDENHLLLAHDAAPELTFKTVVPLDPARVAELRAAGRLPNLPAEELSTNLPALEQGLDSAADQPLFVAEAHAGGDCLEQMAVVRLKTQPWFVVYAQPQEVFLAPIEKALRATLVLAAIIAALVVAAAIVMAHWLTGPITRLTAVAEQITAGDMTMQARVESGDEIGRLALTFNSMTARLRQTLEGLEQRNQQLYLEITERQRAEEALKRYSEQLKEMVEERTQELCDAQEQMLRREKLAVLGQLAGGVGHDLRNPLGVISNAVYFLKMVHTDAGETTREYLDIIEAEVVNADAIVSDLMDFARTREPAIEQVPIPVLIADLLLKCPPPENVQVNTDLPADLPSVFVDPRQVKRALVNLVTNAYQAMPEGGRLTIETSEVSGKPPRSVAISITDTGSGISPENVKKLFEPLFTTKSRGIGLGLATAKNLVEANGGIIEVESPSTKLRAGEEGKGSTFFVTLPLTGS